ncbi:MAG: 16S rRNA (cytosine(1402)-N(4))-methyltransferase RsmH [Phycisphaerales bacterium]
MNDRVHIPVLPQEVLAALAPQPGEICLDCTAGLGGHAAMVAERVGPTGTLVLTDLDAGNLVLARKRVEAMPNAPKVVAMHANFAEAPRRLVELGLSADMVLADLGFSSSQVDDAARGFSFMREGPLDMRLDAGPADAGGLPRPTAADLVNTLPEHELAEILREFGEERRAELVASKIVGARKNGPILTTAQLAAVVRSCVPRGNANIDPCTRTFQALRIAVNDELGNVRALLDSVVRAASLRAGSAGKRWLNDGARVALISFHSLEDRPVKQAFAELFQRGIARPLGSQPTEAGDAERKSNPRARSAKLRAMRIAYTPS